ncbi:MAG: TlyA family rRNA (cytidine-2'-O)-methyltransferase [Acidocella sp. 20-57-95]|nr:MAG: TlyA family rRNA (cytidine-2'-O)-methyltransferase [Acidocella sp. 20-57-95]HQT63030.1 TlyA family RNA methyltransferase [Acidocella sp.]HQU03374.1 TlyA family RNA methyltransferase [Acidocella sp.]
MPKTRADLALVARGLVESRAKAQALIMAGLVYVETARVNKAGDMIADDKEIILKGQEHPWVSRGGVKLAHGLAHFGFDPTGRIGLDVGASTGGFTDVLLTNGAAHVYAVDVGHGQLAWKLRSNPRVTVLEKTNARHLTSAIIPQLVTALVCDASFIGLQIVLPAAMALCVPGAFAVALIKPQFEAGPEHVGKGGVVRDGAIHEAVCAKISDWWAGLPGWEVRGVARSPITGPEGNVEFLIGAVKL